MTIYIARYTNNSNALSMNLQLRGHTGIFEFIETGGAQRMNSAQSRAMRSRLLDAWNSQLMLATQNSSSSPSSSLYYF